MQPSTIDTAAQITVAAASHASAVIATTFLAVRRVIFGPPAAPELALGVGVGVTGVLATGSWLWLVPGAVLQGMGLLHHALGPRELSELRQRFDLLRLFYGCSYVSPVRQ